MSAMNPEETPPPEAEAKRSGRTPEGAAASCRNAIRDGLRSRTEFPPAMADRIAERKSELDGELKPRTALERVFVTEIARTSVQLDEAEELIAEETVQVRETFEETWDDDRTLEINKKADKIGADPYKVQKALLQTKHGVEWLLYRWRLLDDMIVCKSGLNETQRRLCFDLLGVPLDLRDGTATVPAADDAPALRALVAREVRRLEVRLKGELEHRDLVARRKVKLGVKTPPDANLRRLKSDRSRAYKRMTWAYGMLEKLRAGLLTGPIIDPETKRPMAGTEGTEAPAAGAPGAATVSRPTAPPQSTSDLGPTADRPEKLPPEDPIPLPDNLCLEDEEALAIMGVTLRSLFRQGLLRPPGGGPPLP
jgi:hypothetical protein